MLYERQVWASGFKQVAGMDEAGRGPLAGPVVAAAVIIHPEFLERESSGVLSGLNDSKQLSEAERDHFFQLLTGSAETSYGVGLAEAPEIDDKNILRATHLAMQRAVAHLPFPPDHILIDGRPVPNLPHPSTAIVGGDGKSLLIAAASVIAKVTRDAIMKKLDAQYPQYGFARHKGYGTPEHLDALRKYGPCPIHRRSFEPVVQPTLNFE